MPVSRDFRSGDDFMVFRPLGLQTQSLDPQPSVGADTWKVEETLRLQVYRSVFRSVWGFGSDETLKNPRKHWGKRTGAGGRD